LGVTLKLATSLDGRIATAAGESRWITGEEARARVHRLRAEHDAVVIGIETALADDPELNVRLEGHEGAQPARVVLDTRQRLPLGSKLAQTARDVRTYLVARQALSESLVDRGVLFIPDGRPGSGLPDLRFVVEALKAEGIEELLVEGGGKVAASFLKLDLVDRIEWFRAPMVLGEEGRPGVGPMALGRLAEAPRFRRTFINPLGQDLWERYERL